MKSQKKINSRGIIELLQNEFDPDPEDLPTDDMITKNLRLGRFLILVVGDKIRESMIEMLNFVNRYPQLATNVGLVEMKCYVMPGTINDILVVPSIIARTQIVERSIVQVNLVPNVDHQIIIAQKKFEEVKRQGRTPITEDAFWELLQQNSPECVSDIHTIIDHMSEISEVLMKMRQSAISFRLMLPDSDQKISLFLIYTNGSVECWPETIIHQLMNAGISTSIGLEYKSRMSKILKLKRKGGSIHSQASKVDLPAFFELVDWFVQEALNFERKLRDDNML